MHLYLHFVVYISLASRIVTDQDRCQLGCSMVLVFHPHLDLLAELTSNVFSDLLAIDEFGIICSIAENTKDLLEILESMTSQIEP